MPQGVVLEGMASTRIQASMVSDCVSLKLAESAPCTRSLTPIEFKRLSNLPDGVRRAADECAIVRADGIDCGVICGPVTDYCHQPAVFQRL